jgi:hypothetical protein
MMLMLQELVAVNTKLQVVARSVAAEAERTREEVAAEYRQRWEGEQATLQAETERLKQVWHIRLRWALIGVVVLDGTCTCYRECHCLSSLWFTSTWFGVPLIVS